MAKILTLMTVVLLACGVRAEDSYLYWMLDQTGWSPSFAYARLAAQDESGEKTWLMVADADPATYNIFDLSTAPNTRSLPDIYSVLPKDITTMTFFVELFGANGIQVGISQIASYTDISDFIYNPMSQTGLSSPFHFTAAIPEPSGGLLFLLGIGIVALRRRKTANPAHPSP